MSIDCNNKRVHEPEPDYPCGKSGKCMGLGPQRGLGDSKKFFQGLEYSKMLSPSALHAETWNAMISLEVSSS